MNAAAENFSGECMSWPVERWRELQRRRFADHLRCAGRSGLYRAVPVEKILTGLTADNLLEKIRALPLTTKDDLAAAGPSAWAIPPAGVREWVCTSGTAGKPLDVPLSRRDLERLADNEAAAFTLAGIRAGDTVILAVAMDRMFVAGLAYWLGAQKIGATVVRLGSLTGSLANVITRLPEPPTTNDQVPSTNDQLPMTNDQMPAPRLFVVAVASLLANAPVPDRKVAGIIAIGEPTRHADLSLNLLGGRLEERFACPVMSTYASTETCTTFAESPDCRGGHLNPALGILEIINASGTPAAPGEVGEVVVTPLGVEAFPLLRFRTGDMAAFFDDPCPCGRTTPRLGPILGRRQQLLKIRGANLYPGAIIEALGALGEVEDSLVIAERDVLGSDRVVVYVVMQQLDNDSTKGLQSRLAALLRVTPEIQIVNRREIAALRPPGARKIQRFLDRR